MTAAPIEPVWETFDRDDATIEFCRWGDSPAPAAVILIAHGASEHAARYTRVASLLVEDGAVVYGIDHRGHGRTADRHGTPGIARPGGWIAMVDDIATLAVILSERHTGVPVALFGHSMGSLLGQRVLQLHGELFAAAVLSGTSGSLEGAEDLVALLQGIEAAEGPDTPSELFAGMFAGFNEPFAAEVEDPTGFEWLSRDRDEVARYVADPWCGGPLSNGFVTDMITGMAAMWKPEQEARIPTDLPILLIAGETDPVGEQGASVRQLADRYETIGKGPVTLRLYPDARHELLNETNRDEIHQDLRAWFVETLPIGTTDRR
jgi:alpha-beta hydrolase superfamily lysophospholipase